MPDGMNLTPAKAKPELIAEERANRLHALIVAIYNMRPDCRGLSMSEDEAENVCGNLASMAIDESRALLDGFR